MTGLCHSCQKGPADDEYHFFVDGREVVWKLCGDCCEFACDMVELFSNLEAEMETWT